MDGGPGRGGELPVDVPHQRVHVPAELAVGLDVLARGTAPARAAPCRAAPGGAPAAPRRRGAGGDALGVVEPVDPTSKRTPRRGGPPPGPSRRATPPGASSARRRCPWGRCRAAPRGRPVIRHVGGDAGEAERRGGEVCAGSRRCGTHQVGSEAALHEPLRCGRSGKTSDDGTGCAGRSRSAPPGSLPEHLRHEHELVVVHPDEVSRLVPRGESRRRSARSRLVRASKVADLERDAGREVSGRPAKKDPVGVPS